MTPKSDEQRICHYHRGPFKAECPLGGKCETLEDWKPVPPAGAKPVAEPSKPKVFRPQRVRPFQLGCNCAKCKPFVDPKCHFCSNRADEHINGVNVCPNHYSEAVK